MENNLYPLLASKILRHCNIYLSTINSRGSDELVEFAFNEFVLSTDRFLQYLQKELNKVSGDAGKWFVNKRDTLPHRMLFYELRHVITHHYFMALTPIICVQRNTVPSEKSQVSEYRLDLELVPKDKGFDKKREEFIKKYGPSFDITKLSNEYFVLLSEFLKEAEQRYENKEHYRKQKFKFNIRLNPDLTVKLNEREF